MIVQFPLVPYACSCSLREIDEVWTSMNPSLEARLGEAAVQLADEFRGIYGAETIRRFAVETVGLFRNARVTRVRPSPSVPIHQRATAGFRPIGGQIEQRGARDPVRVRPQCGTLADGGSPYVSDKQGARPRPLSRVGSRRPNPSERRAGNERGRA